MNTREMGIYIFDLAEGVVCLHTARDPAEEGPLPSRIAGTHIAVLSHRLPDAEVLPTSEGRERPHLPQACLLHGQPYDVASHPPYLHNASHSQDTGWISLGCKQVGEPVAMHLEARILPHLLQGYFSPWCTPMCFISL